MITLPWRDIRIGDGVAFCTSLLTEEADRLAELAEGRNVLEVGSAFGYSATVMALAGALHVTAIDLHCEQGGTRKPMEANLAACGVADRVTIVQERSDLALKALAEAGGRYGLAFIDADHNRDAVAADVRGCLALLEPGGYLACHDYGESTCPGVAEALNVLYPDGPDSLHGTLWVKRF